MKNFHNKAFFWGNILLFLKGSYVLAQPIQLVPQQERAPEYKTQLSQQIETPTFWEGTPPSVIETYFPKLPLWLNSFALRSLRSDLLKERLPAFFSNLTNEKALVSLLIDIGQFNQAKEFLLETNLPEKEKVLLDILWIEGESKKACEKITNFIRISSDPIWKMQNIYCLFLNGESERGKVAAEVLKESSPDVSPFISVLFDPLFKPSFEESIAKSPFLLTIWCATGQDIPEKALQEMPPAMLALVAKSEKVLFPIRLFAAEKVFQAGLLQRETLLKLFEGSSGDSLLEKFAQTLKSPKPENILPLLEKAESEQKRGLVFDVFKPFFLKIEPSIANLPLAPYFIKGFLEIREYELAQKWMTFLKRESPDEAIAFLPLLYLANPQTKWDEPQFQAWQAHQQRVHPQKAAQNSYILRQALKALGEASGPALKDEPIAPSWRQEKVLFDEKTLALLDSAASSKKKGEALLITLTLIGETNLKDLPPDKFIRLLSILYKTGYTTEARVLALEFLLAQGI